MTYDGIYVNHGRNAKRPEALNVGLYSPGGIHQASFIGYVDHRRNGVKLYPSDWVTRAFYKVHEISLFDLKNEEALNKIRERDEKHEKSNVQ